MSSRDEERRLRKKRAAMERRKRLAPLIERIRDEMEDHLDGSYILRRVKEIRNEKAEAAKKKFAAGTAVTWNDGYGVPHVGIVQGSERAVWRHRNDATFKTAVQIMVFDSASSETYQIDPGELVTATDMDEAVGS